VTNPAGVAEPGALAGRPAAAAVVAAEAVRAAKAYVVRFDGHQRLQHFLMMSTFIALALTGLPQKFSGLDVSEWWVNALGGLEMVRTIHRTAGLIMLGDCAYHLSYLVYRIGVQRDFGPLRMIPTPQDLLELHQTMLHLLGLSTAKPKFGRFTYVEKFDYWAVFWGIVMIGVSGLVLMFPVKVTEFLPGQAITVAIAVHSDEAMLAVGWIAIMHMFNAHLAPGVFPINTTIFTGKLSTERCAEEHPLEWERLAGSEGMSEPPTAQAQAGDTGAATTADSSQKPPAEDGPWST
jgi:cytochrome b subunit of formate dehydrogenase